MFTKFTQIVAYLLSDLTCTSRDNARALRPVLRGAGGAIPPLPTRHFYSRKLMQPNRCIPKILLIMRLTTILIIFSIVQVSATTFAQKITLSAKNEPLAKVFADIRKQTGYDFVLTIATLNNAKPVSIQVKDVEIEQVLKMIFEGQPLEYKLNDKSVVVSKKEPSFLDKLKEAFAIPIRVDGRVTDSVGNALPGASIKIKDKVMRTDNDGKFSFSAEPGTEVTVSFVGYQSYLFKATPDVGFQNVVLKAITGKLEEVVVSTGYQQLSKERATGSFDYIDNKQIQRTVSTDILSRIANIANGVQYDPGQNPAANGATGLRIRGRSTIFSNPQPLIVLDNFPYEGDINNINPNDIESVTILKDAAASSIWGVKAGNGVMVLTSKKGKLNQPLQVSLNANVTVSGKPNINNGPNISSKDYIGLEKYLFDQGFYDFPLTDTWSMTAISPAVQILAKQRDGLISAADANAQMASLERNNVRSDLSKYWYQRAVNQQYALNLSGGGPNNKYYLSGGWDNNLSNQVGNINSRVTLNASNIFTSIDNKWTISSSIRYTQGKTSNNAQFPSPGSGQLYPYAQLVGKNGEALTLDKYNSNFIDTAGHGKLLDWRYRPLDELRNSDNTRNSVDYLIDLGLNYKILTWLNIDGKYQYGKGSSDTRNLQNANSYYTRDLINTYSQIDPTTDMVTRPIPLGGIMDLSNTKYTSQYARASLNFNPNLGEKGQLIGIIGAEIRDLATNGLASRLYGYNSQQSSNLSVDYVNLYPSFINGSTNAIPSNSVINASIDRYISLFGNVGYTYDGKYTISASARRDGTNFFGVNTNQKWNPLWSAGLAWDVGKEPFIDNNKINALKFRATYGYSGNINKSVSALLVSSITGTNSLGETPAYIINPPNPNLRWEKISQINLGIDFAFLNSRLNGSIDYYHKSGMDLFGNASLAPSSGLGYYLGNTSNISGQGFDFAINNLNLDGKFKWLTNFNLNYNTDKVTYYGIPSTSNSDYVIGSDPIVGRPLYSIYSYKWSGLDHNHGNPQGYLNGMISEDYGNIMQSKNPADIVYNGPSLPPVFGNLLNNFTWNAITLSVNITYRFGNYFRVNSVEYNQTFNGSGLPHSDYLKRWQNPGDEAKTNVPSIIYPADPSRDQFYKYSSALVQKGDLVRLNDIRLNYDFGSLKRNLLGLRTLNIYAYASNLGLLWTANHLGIDPDHNPSPSYNYTTPPKTISIGLNTTF